MTMPAGVLVTTTHRRSHRKVIVEALTGRLCNTAGGMDCIASFLSTSTKRETEYTPGNVTVVQVVCYLFFLFFFLFCACVLFFFVAVLVSTVVFAALILPSGGFTTRQCNKTEWQQIEKYTQGTCIFKEAFVLLFASSNYQLWFFALTKFWLRFEAEKGNLEILNFSFVLKTD